MTAEEQSDELSALEAVFPDLVHLGGDGLLWLRVASARLELEIQLPKTYPNSGRPTFSVTAPSLSAEKRREIVSQLEAILTDNEGPVLHLFAQLLLDFANDISESCSLARPCSSASISEVAAEIVDDRLAENGNSKLSPCYNDDLTDFVAGPIIEDRKSVFQAHAAAISDRDQVPQLLARLRENRKIARATHNIWAYCVERRTERGTIRDSDCEDDGETTAGGRLLELLSKIGVSGVLVVVSRWYGGIHLGPDRFRHINNAAKSALRASNLMPAGK